MPTSTAQPFASTWSTPGLALRGLLLLSLFAGAHAAQNGKDTPTLEPGRPLTGKLAGGQSHSYAVVLKAGQFLLVVVEQRGIDIVVALFDPGGKKIVEVDSPNGKEGPEPLSFVAETPGTYRLEVRSLEDDAPAGSYEAKVRELRAATARDVGRVAAERAFREAESLRLRATAESLRQSIEKYEESLPSYRAAEDGRGEATALNNIGLVYSSLGEKRKALDNYSQALPLWRVLNDVRGEAVTLSNMGAAYNSLGESRRALDHLMQSLRLFRAVRDRSGEATTLSNIGLTQHLLEDRRGALESYSQALNIYRELGAARGEATTLNNVGAIYDELAEPRQALDSYQKALELYRVIGDRSGEATALNNVGAVYSALGERRKALDSYRQSLELFRLLGDKTSEAAMLNNVGAIHASLGEPQQALDNFMQALPLRQAVEDRRGEATTLNNIGLVHGSTGEQHLALDNYLRAVKLWRSVGDQRGEATTLGNIGGIYYELGEVKLALDNFERALLLHRSTLDRRGEATTLNNIGLVHSSQGEQRRALDSYTQSLKLSRETKARGDEATALNNTGAAYSALGEKRKALDSYRQALELYRLLGDRDSEATALNNISAIYYEIGEPQRALDGFAEVLRLYREVRDSAGEATALGNTALIERSLGDVRGALGRIRQALTLVESLRIKISSQELRTSYFATAQEYYEFEMSLLMTLHKQQPGAGHESEALQVSERARARSLLDVLTGERADIRKGVDPGLLAQERSLRQTLNAKAHRQAELLNGSYTSQEAVAISKEIAELSTELQHVEGQISQTAAHYAGLMQPRPLTLRQIQSEALDPDTLLLEYALGRERSYLWTVTPTSVMSYELPGRAEVETAARQFTELLASYGAAAELEKQHDDWLRIGGRLSRMLLGPVARQLKQKRLVIVADGALHYVPFAALPALVFTERKPEGRRPLVVQHEIVSLPSISIVPTLRAEATKRPPAPQTLAVLADPVFSADDARVKRASTRMRTGRSGISSAGKDGATGAITSDAQEGVRDEPRRNVFERLAGARREGQGILALAPPNKALAAFDFNARRELVVSGKLSKYRYVHFATHAQVNSLHPGLSSVVLSLVDENGNTQNGYLRLNEIYNLNLRADMVGLSGCDTSLGKALRGEGLISLTRGFMYAGAPRVLASLWRVDDQVTAELMVRFYRGILKEAKRPADALRAAQVEMMTQTQWRSPRYWAAFILQGEWR